MGKRAQTYERLAESLSLRHEVICVVMNMQISDRMGASPFVFKCVCTLYQLLQVFREESWKHQLRDITRKKRRSKKIKSDEIKNQTHRRQISAKETATSEEILRIYGHRLTGKLSLHVKDGA